MYTYDYVRSVYLTVFDDVEDLVDWSEEEVFIEAYLNEGWVRDRITGSNDDDSGNPVGYLDDENEAREAVLNNWALLNKALEYAEIIDDADSLGQYFDSRVDWIELDSLIRQYVYDTNVDEWAAELQTHWDREKEREAEKAADCAV